MLRYFLLPSYKKGAIILLAAYRTVKMRNQEKTEIRQGTLALMILKTLEAMGSLHGYGIARRIEQTSDDAISVPYGTIYPSLIKLEQEGYISSTWQSSNSNRRAKYYALTRAGRRHLEHETQQWEQTVNLISRFFTPGKETV